MDTAAVTAIATELLPPDQYSWTLEPLSHNGNRLRAYGRDSTEAVEFLDTGGGAFVLTVGNRMSHADFGYEDDDAWEVIREQLGRVRTYLDGAVVVTDIRRGNTVTATKWSFPDGMSHTVKHGGLTGLVNRLFRTNMSSATVEYRD